MKDIICFWKLLQRIFANHRPYVENTGTCVSGDIKMNATLSSLFVLFTKTVSVIYAIILHCHQSLKELVLDIYIRC